MAIPNQIRCPEPYSLVSNPEIELDCLSWLALALLSLGLGYGSLLKWFSEALILFIEWLDKDTDYL